MRFALPVCVALLMARPVVAQDAVAARSETTLDKQVELSRSIIRLLRDGELAQALRGLESAGEQPQPLSHTDEDGLAQACAGIHRALKQLSSEERFELLSKWSMPATSPVRIRMLTALVPTARPPAEFARVLGERPQARSFDVAAIGEVKGIFNTGWLLVEAARESGRLKRLTADLKPFVDKNAPNADLLMSLVQIVDNASDLTSVTRQLSGSIEDLKASLPEKGSDIKPVDAASVVTAVAARSRQPLRPLGEEMLSLLLAGTVGQSSPRVRPFLQKAYATAVLTNRAESKPEAILEEPLKYWLPVAEARGATSDWVMHEGHAMHVSGSGSDVLLFRYPLKGEFEFHCETQCGGRSATDGGIVFGGLHYQPRSNTYEMFVRETRGALLARQFCPFLCFTEHSVFNRYSIASTSIAQASSPASAPGGAELVTFRVNQHPMWIYKPGIETSPWFGLRSLDERQPLFRSLKLTGRPVVPRQVSLFSGSEMRGWQSTGDVGVSDGVMQFPELGAGGTANTTDTHAFYQRPLLSGETFKYQFFYHSKSVEISPTLGRVAFLLQPEGVRLRWLVDQDYDWTSLTPENVVAEPLNRRGPKPLPFKSSAWNQVSVARSGQTLTISLNDVVIYQRAIDWSGDLRIGLYQAPKSHRSLVREPLLTGDWPESVADDFNADPGAQSKPSLIEADKRAINHLLREERLSDNALSVHRLACQMPLAERWEYLSKWILPTSDRPSFRLTGDFTQTRPSPPAREPGTAMPSIGGEIVSPVYDWIDAARELGRLGKCRDLVAAARVPDDGYHARCRYALQMLISLEQGDQAAIAADFEQLFALVKGYTPTGLWEQWPETLVVNRGVRQFINEPGIVDLITYIHGQRTLLWRPPELGVWHAHIASLVSIARTLKGKSEETPEHASGLGDQWIPASNARFFNYGQGYPISKWRLQDHQAIHQGGPEDDFLFFRLPLKGDYEVQCEFRQPDQHSGYVLLGGTYTGASWDDKNIEVGTLRTPAHKQPVGTRMSRFGPIVYYRGVVRDNKVTVYLNGRQVYEEILPQNPDPWIAIRSWQRILSHVQDIRVLGNPTVLDAVPLSGSAEMSGWFSYHDDTVGPNGRWIHVDDPESSGWIVGRSDKGFAGMQFESLLRYQRPLVEDGTIDYEFYYEPGVYHVSPTFDRLTFLLDESGVREHWNTDYRFDRTNVSPGNASVVQQSRRGPDRLPLQPRAWNRASLKLTQSQLQIFLNSQLVYERELEPENQRTFGFFHYMDGPEVRVRNVVMRGDWPKSLPSLSNQRLARPLEETSGPPSAPLKAVFAHNFETDGLPSKYFKLGPPSSGIRMSAGRNGVEYKISAAGTWITADILPRFSLSGDFEIDASFRGLQITTTKSDAGIHALVSLQTPQVPRYGLSRILTDKGVHHSNASQSFLLPDKSRSWTCESKPFEAAGGRIRLARTGETLWCLFAEEDSEVFRLVHKEKVAPDSTAPDSISLQAFCISNGTCGVTWKSLSLRAESMTWYPEVAESSGMMLYVMNADGSALHKIATPSTFGLTGLGSPEWSSDGRRIVLDVSNGSVATSHVVVMNADGSDARDLGTGCMPSFNKEGNMIVMTHPGKGIVMMNADGTGMETIDQGGWGVQWSPDGKSLAYGKSGNIVIMDIATRKSRPLFTGEHATRYSYTTWNLGWSHDSKLVCFKGRRRDTNGHEIVVLNVEKENSFTVVVPRADTVNEDFTFTPDNQYVMFSMPNTDLPGPQLHTVNWKKPEEPKLLPAQPPGHKVFGCAWSRDGKSIAFASQQVPVPMEWINAAVSDPAP